MSAILESALDGERRAECAKHDAEQGLNPTMQQALSDALRAADYWAGVASQEAQRKERERMTREVKVRPQYKVAQNDEPEPCACGSILRPELDAIDRALADSFAGEKPFEVKP